MDAKRYAEILKSVLRMQVIERTEEMKRRGEYSSWEEGIIRGLEIAMEKIDKSAFLLE